MNGFQNHYYVTPLNPAGGGYYQNGATGGFYRPGYAVVTPAYPTPLRQSIGPGNDQDLPDEEAAPDEPPPRPSAGPIVKPKIIVPPPKREY
jgi:hypothetical protein